MLRFLFWRTLGLVAALATVGLLMRLLNGDPVRLLRGGAGGGPQLSSEAVLGVLSESARWLDRLLLRAPGLLPWRPALLMFAAAAPLALLRLRARRKRTYVRLRVLPYRTDFADVHALTRMFSALQGRLLRRWWERLQSGQPSAGAGGAPSTVPVGPRASAWLAVTCPAGDEATVEAALQVAYPNMRLVPSSEEPGAPPCVLRLKKHRPFVERVSPPRSSASSANPSL